MPELLKCSFCHDPLTTDDNDSNLCGACADGLKAEKYRLLKENANLNDWLKTWKESFDLAQTEIAKLKANAIVWHKYPDEKPPIDGRYLFWDSDGNAPHVLPHNDIVVRDNPGVFSTQTHWAYLPELPKED